MCQILLTSPGRLYPLGRVDGGELQGEGGGRRRSGDGAMNGIKMKFKI